MSAYDPSEHNIEEVKSHVEENPAEAAAVLEAEKAGDARVTLVSFLEKLVESQDEAPVPVAAPAVTVEPAAAPGLLDNFEVSADRGYRRKG